MPLIIRDKLKFPIMKYTLTKSTVSKLMITIKKLKLTKATISRILAYL
jgi:hypothetical protein